MTYDNSIGAWWLGFLIIAGVKLIAIAALLFGFPKSKRSISYNENDASVNVKDELKGWYTLKCSAHLINYFFGHYPTNNKAQM